MIRSRGYKTKTKCYNNQERDTMKKLSEKEYLAISNLAKLRIAESILRNTLFMDDKQEEKLKKAIIEVDRLVSELEKEID